MDRREFLKVTGAGALTLFLSGCGINAVSGDKKAGAAPSAGGAEAKPGGVSNGKKLKIVVLCGSPHKAGTSALLADNRIRPAPRPCWQTSSLKGRRRRGMKYSASMPPLKTSTPAGAAMPAA